MSFALTYEDWVTNYLANPMTTGAGSGESTCRCEVQILAALCMLPCWSSAGYEVEFQFPYIWLYDSKHAHYEQHGQPKL